MTNSCSLWSVLDSDGYMKTISSTSTTFLSAWVYHLSSDLETLVDYKPGWWFGTFFIFPYIWNFIIPTDFHIFQRGWYTTNQKWKILFKWMIIMENPIKSMVNLCHEPSLYSWCIPLKWMIFRHQNKHTSCGFPFGHPPWFSRSLFSRSLESWLIRGIIPIAGPTFQVRLVNYYNWPIYICTHTNS